MSSNLEGSVLYGSLQINPWRSILFDEIPGSTTIETVEKFTGLVEIELDIFVSPNDTSATDNIVIKEASPAVEHKLWSQKIMNTTAPPMIDIHRHLILDCSPADVVLIQNFSDTSRVASYVFNFRLMRYLEGLKP